MARPITLFNGQWADLCFIRRFGARILTAHMKDVWRGEGDGTVGTFGDPRRLDFPPAKGAFDVVFDKARQGGMAGSAP
jgi:hypothetical protein